MPQGHDNEEVLKKMHSDFEKMIVVRKYYEAKSCGKLGDECYPSCYSKKKKRALRRYANKYHLKDSISDDEDTWNNSTWKDMVSQKRQEMEYVKSNTDSSLENEIRHGNQQTALANANIDEEYCVQAETSSFITRETLIVIEDDVKSSGQVINQNVYHKRMLSSSEVVDTIWKGCNVGYIEGKIDGVCISDNRLLELRGQGFISDKIIDAYLSLLSRKYSNPNVNAVAKRRTNYVLKSNGRTGITDLKIDEKLEVSTYSSNMLCKSAPFEIILYDDQIPSFKTEYATVFRVFWKMRIKALGADDIPWNYSPVVHPKQRDSYNCGIYILKFAEALLLDGNGGSTRFSDSREDLEKYRKEIAEQLIECSDNKETGWCSICGFYRSEDSEIMACTICSRWIHTNCKGETMLQEGESFECSSCTAALIFAINEAQLPPIGSAPSATTAPKAASTPSKKPESHPVTQHAMTMIKVTSKTHARRCESCKSAFKEKGYIKQRYMIGNYGPRPFFKKATKTWHDGTRNYYYRVKKECLKTIKNDIIGSDIDVSQVKNDLLASDIAKFENESLHISN
eukprot:gene13469-14860_t